MASKRVKIVISKIDIKDEIKEWSLETHSTNDDISAPRNARKFKKKNKLIAFEKLQSRVQSRLCSSNHLDMASKRVKIVISSFLSILETICDK